MEFPPGHEQQGKVLRLKKALYGLRRSPLLWQRHLENGLKAMGMERVAGENCCWRKGRVLFFFYVDDCVLAFPPECRNAAERLINGLKEKYHLEGGDPLHWFLGIEVTRDRAKKKIWLSQAAYAQKIARLIGQGTHKGSQRKNTRFTTPMTNEELLPAEEHASKSEITAYQRKIRSILYLAVMTRPDIAFAASRLARFNQNPSQKHHRAADRVLQYILDTCFLSLEYDGNNKSFEVASDASFADNSLDRKSSQAYALRLAGGLIGWRANKQDTVTTSTTEAELLALSQAAREAIFVSRLLSALNTTIPSGGITIQCDNL